MIQKFFFFRDSYRAEVLALGTNQDQWCQSPYWKSDSQIGKVFRRYIKKGIFTPMPRLNKIFKKKLPTNNMQATSGRMEMFSV